MVAKSIDQSPHLSAGVNSGRTSRSERMDRAVTRPGALSSRDAMTTRTPTEIHGNRRLDHLLHGADALGLARSGIGSATGTPLPAELAAVVGADLSRVRLHRGEQAAAAAAALGARA